MRFKNLPKPQFFVNLKKNWHEWATQFVEALEKQEINQVVVHPQYQVLTLPSANAVGSSIYVTDEAGGATLAVADGTAWRRVKDGAIVS